MVSESWWPLPGSSVDESGSLGAILLLVHHCGTGQQSHHRRFLQETGKSGQLFNFLWFQGSYIKGTLVSFRILEIPSPEKVCAKDTSEPVTTRGLWHSFPVRPTSASKTVSSWDSSVTPKIRMTSGLYSLITLGCTMHHCPQEPYTPVGLMCEAIKSTQSNRPTCPFPPPGRMHILSSPGYRTHCSLLRNISQKSFYEGLRWDQPFYSVWETAHWKLEQQFFCKNSLCGCFSLQLTNSCL